MAQQKFLPSEEDFLTGMARIGEEAMAIRRHYEIVDEYQLHKLAATISTDLLNLVFGWDGTPAVSGKEIKPFRITENV